MQAAAGAGGGVVEPVGIDFDGTNDYLSRSSDLTGNSDGKTFTFSAWVYPIYSGGNRWLYHSSSYAVDDGIDIFLNSSGRVFVYGYSSSPSQILNASTSASLPENTWSHILISVDLSNSSNRHIYVNDASSSASFSVYSNVNINFTNTSHYIFGMPSPYTPTDGRIAGVYLDYTYRDLSVEANRRDFIDENGLYVTPPTSGIISVPMDDPDDPGRNDGTGGDFTLNGIVAQSGRGPNQYNAVASEFDGVNDVLELTGVSGITSTNKFTFSANFVYSNFANTIYYLHYTRNSLGNSISQVHVNPSTKTLNVWLNSDGSSTTDDLLNLSVPIEIDRNYSVDISIDLASQSNSKVFLNGVDTSFTASKFVNGNVQYSAIISMYIGAQSNGDRNVKSIGEVYFDTTYIDLATDNPFWDSDAGKPKLVRQVLEETGNTPLIAMPIRADDPGNNLGTVGDFTLNGGGLVGARGASEYIARTAAFRSNGAAFNTNYLSLNTPTITSTPYSLVMEVSRISTSSDLVILNFGTFYLVALQDEALRITTNNSVPNVFVEGGDENLYEYLYISYTGTGNFLQVYEDSTLTNLNVYAPPSFTGGTLTIGRGTGNGLYDFHGNMGNIYFTTDYIDFSQEANRNLFRDQLGFPRDLKPLIEDGTIPNPLIYLPFDDTDNLGKNLGTGGDFTVTGTVTAGSDVDPS